MGADKANSKKKEKSGRQSDSREQSHYAEAVLLFAAVLAAGLISFAIHGAWPFGSLVLEGDDGYRQHIPELYYLWDMLHAKAAYSFDWYTSFGVSPVGSFIHFGIFSPLNIVYLFIPRSAVLYSVNIMSLLRMVLLAFSFRYALRRLGGKKRPSSLVIILSLAYVFNSWSIHYLYFSQWVDVAILLPLLVCEAVALLKGMRRLPYMVLLSVSLLICIQQDYMLVLFFIFFTALYLIFSGMEKKEKTSALIRLALCSIAAAMISCIILLPAAALVGDTARVSGNIIYQIKQILRSNAHPDHTYDAQKLLLMGSCLIYGAVAVILIIFRLISKKPIRRKIAGTVIFALMLMLPLVIESIHYFWQGGEYICFPLRGGYMPVFVMLMLIAMLLEDIKWPKALCGKKAAVIITVAAAAALIPLCAYRMKRAELGYGKKALYAAENSLHTLMGGADPAMRLADKKGKLQLNYTLVSRVASQENWIHIIPAVCQSECDALGYKHDGSALYGRGGTVFSDAVLGTRYAITEDDADERLYKPYAKAGNVNISECLYTAPFGAFLENADAAGEGALKNQQKMAKDILGEELFTLKETGPGETLKLNAEDESLFYYEGMSDNDMQLSVNGESIKAHARQISTLGIFSGDIEISAPDGGIIAFLSLNSLLDKKTGDSISELKMHGNTLSCRVEYKGEGKYLFLPLNNIKGFECSLNGKKAETVSVYGGFMAVVFPDEEGVYELTIRYHLPYQTAGILISIAGLVLAVCLVKFKLDEKLSAAAVGRIAYPVFLAGAGGAFTLIYIADIILLVFS